MTATGRPERGFIHWHNLLLRKGLGAEDASEVATLICDAITETRASEQAGVADDLRALGWSVAVHNDYRLNGQPYTFWLFTKDGRAIQGEGRDDREALSRVRFRVDLVGTA